nr:RNA-binding protein Musashi Rbp6 like [Ipomoea batatas]
MPIALRARNSDDFRTGLPEFATGMVCISMFRSPEFSVGGQRGEAIVENDDGRSSSLSCLSIGRISYDSASAGDVDGDGEEVQSSAKGGALHSLEHLEEALPLKSCQQRTYFAMDAAYPEVPVELKNLFHEIDRKLYSILVFELERDPKVSVNVIALWIWLEKNKIKNAVDKILSSSIKMINGLADDAEACLRCITDAMYLFSSDASEISLTQNVLGKQLSLKFFHENRANALCGIRMVVETVCVKEPKDDRTMYATFSNGYPVFDWELWGYFIGMYGDCVESISMQAVKPNEQSMFALIVFSSPRIVHLILRGRETANFTIKGKEVWIRKCIRKA